MKPRLLLLVGLALCALPVIGQSTADPLHVELTLSAGHYPEAIASDTLQRIGQFGYSTVTGKAYRFGVQGQEEDDEIHGARGTRYSFEHRMHDPRVGRFLSLDPLAAKYPHNSPYAFSENRVIDAVELEGLEKVEVNDLKNPNDPNSQVNVFSGNITEMPISTEDERAYVDAMGQIGMNLNPLAAQVDKFTLNATGPSSEHWVDGFGHGRTDFVNYDYTVQYFGQDGEEYEAAGSVSIPYNEESYLGIKDAPLIVLSELAVFKILGNARELVHSKPLGTFDDIAANPHLLLGKTESDVAQALGSGWVRGAYGTAGKGWRFTNGDKSVFFHPGGGQHVGAYYGLASGKLGRIKLTSTSYRTISGDKAKIIGVK